MTVGKYKILELIGKGGFASVYKVEDEHLHKEYAMKIIEECSAAQEEAMRLKELQHPGLPLLHDVFETENNTCLVMELSHGKNLKNYVKRQGKLTVSETVKIGLQISEILKYLHKQSVPVIHGDLKPENIMVGPDKIQLIDFGGSYLMYSRREIFYGTPGYAAEELSRGEVLSQSDIYSFGKVLLYMLTGREGILFKAQINVAELKRYGIPKNLRKIIVRCLEKEPYNRYQSGAELMEALHKLRRINRQIPGQGLAMLATICRLLGTAGILYVLYGINASGNFPVREIFVLSCLILILSCVIGRCAASIYHEAILECECSMFVTEGL